MGFQPLIAALFCIFTRLCQGEDHLQITCRSRFYPHNVTCHWTLDEEYRPASEVHAIYRLGKVEKKCQKSNPSFKSCTLNDLILFSNSPYTIIVNASTPLGKVTHKMQFIVEDIVQPDPPSHIKAEQVPGCDSCVHVHWKKPTTYTAGDPVRFRYFLQYRQQIPKKWSVSRETYDERVDLTDARPGALLYVRLASKIARRGRTSAWSKPVTVTPWINMMDTRGDGHRVYGRQSQWAFLKRRRQGSKNSA
uniref:interleukin-27 subunit beta-like n=1 Tax=Myxine glutinosa TaxID=7769 RepID=UPI00358F9B51